jgi:hypothetical protein
MPTFDSLSLYPGMYIPTHAHTRGCADFIRWSSPLRRRHRTMAANPLLRTGSKRAHTETTVLGLLKKTVEPRSCLGELPGHCETFCGPAEFSGSAHGVFGFMPA